MSAPTEKSKKNKKSSSQTILRFSSVGIQMGIVIGASAWGGSEVDKLQTNQKPVWTIVLSLLGVALALYLVIKEALKLSKDDE